MEYRLLCVFELDRSQVGLTEDGEYEIDIGAATYWQFSDTSISNLIQKSINKYTIKEYCPIRFTE